jgi:hypothetical protein
LFALILGRQATPLLFDLASKHRMIFTLLENSKERSRLFQWTMLRVVDYLDRKQQTLVDFSGAYEYSTLVT